MCSCYHVQMSLRQYCWSLTSISTAISSFEYPIVLRALLHSSLSSSRDTNEVLSGCCCCCPAAALLAAAAVRRCLLLWSSCMKLPGRERLLPSWCTDKSATRLAQGLAQRAAGARERPCCACTRCPSPPSELDRLWAIKHFMIAAQLPMIRCPKTGPCTATSAAGKAQNLLQGSKPSNKKHRWQIDREPAQQCATEALVGLWALATRQCRHVWPPAPGLSSKG